MLNMNSPTVQNLIQSGFNPYNNNRYVPQQPIQQNTYYNPYTIQQSQSIDNGNFYYDPMPKVIVNESRGINSNISQSNNNGFNNQQFYYGYNPYVFNGYMNPILMRNQMENDKIRQREESIAQGRIWRTLLQGIGNDDEFDIDYAVQHIESLYYNEPYTPEMSIKQKMIRDKNDHLAQIEARLAYYKQNNIPVTNSLTVMRNNVCRHFNHIEEVIGDMENCDMVDYFTRVYPELKQEQMMREVDSYNKNLKNRYDSNDFNKLIDQVTGDKPDSYYAKLMEGYANNGVKLETSNGLVITADEMEVKLPSRLLKNKQDVYYEQRRKFYDAIFKKEG